MGMGIWIYLLGAKKMGYTLLISRCIMIALNSQSQFGRMIAGSLTLTFLTYVFVNMSSRRF